MHEPQKGINSRADAMLDVCFIEPKTANYILILPRNEERTIKACLKQWFSLLSHDDEDDDDDTEHWSSKFDSCCIQLIIPRDCTAWRQHIWNPSAVMSEIVQSCCFLRVFLLRLPHLKPLLTEPLRHARHRDKALTCKERIYGNYMH